jgi:hypothetical protein
LLKKCPKEDYEDCQEIMKTKSKFDFKNDALGYMKMYNRTARVTPDTVGLDQLWRLKVLIDGPYGTPSQHIFDSEHAVLIASGIGITPFASILQSLMYRYRRAKATCPHCGSKLCEEFIDKYNYFLFDTFKLYNYKLTLILTKLLKLRSLLK